MKRRLRKSSSRSRKHSSSSKDPDDSSKDNDDNATAVTETQSAHSSQENDSTDDAQEPPRKAQNLDEPPENNDKDNDIILPAITGGGDQGDPFLMKDGKALFLKDFRNIKNPLEKKYFFHVKSLSISTADGDTLYALVPHKKLMEKFDFPPSSETSKDLFWFFCRSRKPLLFRDSIEKYLPSLDKKSPHYISQIYEILEYSAVFNIYSDSSTIQQDTISSDDAASTKKKGDKNEARRESGFKDDINNLPNAYFGKIKLDNDTHLWVDLHSYGILGENKKKAILMPRNITDLNRHDDKRNAESLTKTPSVPVPALNRPRPPPLLSLFEFDSNETNEIDGAYDASNENDPSKDPGTTEEPEPAQSSQLSSSSSNPECESTQHESGTTTPEQNTPPEPDSDTSTPEQNSQTEPAEAQDSQPKNKISSPAQGTQAKRKPSPAKTGAVSSTPNSTSEATAAKPPKNTETRAQVEAKEIDGILKMVSEFNLLQQHYVRVQQYLLSLVPYVFWEDDQTNAVGIPQLNSFITQLFSQLQE